MRVLLAHKFHRITGGAEVFYFDVARVLIKNGHEVGYLSTEHESNLSTGCFERFVRPPAYDEGPIVKRVLGSLDIFYSTANKNAMINAIRDFRPDVIHVFAIHVHLTPSILEAANENNVPVLMSCNDYKHICPNYKLFENNKVCEACKGGRFYNAVLKKCCKDSLVFSVASALEAYIHSYKEVYEKLVDRYLFASDFMLEKTHEFWAGKNVSCGKLMNPFDASEYTPCFHGDFALFFGRLVEEKGVDLIIEAAKQSLVPVKIIGDGPELEQLKAKCSSGEISSVEFVGPKWGSDLKKMLYAAKFVVVPSVWHENFPYVIFQAFAAGKPVLGSDRGGIPELVGDTRGVIFNPDDISSLVSGMSAFWNDEGMCQVMGAKAREYVVETFSDERFYSDLMENYQAVLQ